MGRKQTCDGIEIPVRPQQELCIGNGSGGGGCYDARRMPPEYNRDSLKNYVCSSIEDTKTQEEWIKFVLDSCKVK